MHIDPMQNWRSLTENYAQMSDGELLALAEDFGDLTDMARQVLRDEMRKRDLGDPQSVASSPSAVTQKGSFAVPRDGTNASDDGATPEGFIWKNVICECRSREEAWQVSEVLRRAGIETWSDGSQMNYAPLPEMGANSARLRVLVAADQFDAARAILLHPIPPDIIEQSKAEHAEYEPPVCPRCGAPDPLLEAVDPANSWKCEVCGRQWTDAVEPTGEPPPRG